MNRDLNAKEMEALEAMIDAANVQAVLVGISEICGEKAQHIEDNWQDYGLAKVWATACGAIGVFSCSKEIKHPIISQ